MAGYANDVAQLATDLIEENAQNILINNLPNLGLVPGVTAGPLAFAAGWAEELTIAFNDALWDALATVTGANIFLLDAFSLTENIINDVTLNPDPLTNGWGLSNVTDACFVQTDPNSGFSGGPGTTCANPDEYLFWDGLHPTDAGHTLIANFAYGAVVPVPAALPLLLSALLGLGAAKRARKA
ncbi:MAG: hypothetical protein HKO06_09090 [Pseudomonadales bacterium]|nr:hypothetical protein [Pseudomonadales bacterium]